MEKTKSERKLIILPAFRNSVKGIQDYISRDSQQSADKFGDDLKIAIDKIELNPKGYPFEPQLYTKRILYRFKLYKKNYKIIFKVLKTTLIIIDIFHTKQRPTKIRKLGTKDYK